MGGKMERLERRACFGGWQEVWQHSAETLGCEMKVAVYLPPQAEAGPCPVIYWLSGLTCTEQNFITKAGAQRYAAAHGVIIVAPDTSPRGEGVADDDAYDLGQGAGFYVNATEAPWAAHYKMFDYISEELPAWVEAHFPASDKRSICGHSMGGHGALVVALKRPERYSCVSAFAPIVAPMEVPWGHKALGAYLGEDRAKWAEWDACALVKAMREAGGSLPTIRIDQGADDGFLAEQLKPQLFETACEAAGQPLDLRLQPGHDHSYYFIATFIGEHIATHSETLK